MKKIDIIVIFFELVAQQKWHLNLIKTRYKLIFSWKFSFIHLNEYVFTNQYILLTVNSVISSKKYELHATRAFPSLDSQKYHGVIDKK